MNTAVFLELVCLVFALRQNKELPKQRNLWRPIGAQSNSLLDRNTNRQRPVLGRHRGLIRTGLFLSAAHNWFFHSNLRWPPSYSIHWFQQSRRGIRIRRYTMLHYHLSPGGGKTGSLTQKWHIGPISSVLYRLSSQILWIEEPLRVIESRKWQLMFAHPFLSKRR